MKGPDAFRTISEAASELGVPQHVLRFWETKFSFIRPMKRAGGRRFYRRQDIDVLRGVRILLHDEGYTIKGVQRLHKEQGVRRVMAAGGAVESPEDGFPDDGFDDEAGAPFVRPLLGEAARRRLGAVLDDIEGVKARLDALLATDTSLR
jgi:DNA-binding transcriptional MerR regulator